MKNRSPAAARRSRTSRDSGTARLESPRAPATIFSHMARQQENQMVGEVIGLTLLGLGTLLFLALISYNPRDVPAWVPIIANSAIGTHANPNFIGPVGAIIAGYFYFMVG